MTRGNSTRETNSKVVHQAMLRRLPRRNTASGRIELVAAPSLLDHYQAMLLRIFASLGRAFNEQEAAHLRDVLESCLKKGWEASPGSYLVVQYETDEPPKTSLSYDITIDVYTLEDTYQRWTKTRTPPLFGALPDAKVMHLALQQGNPKDQPVLDIGAGSGRNTLPIARFGFPTDAVELAPALASMLRDEVEKARLPVRVFEGDATDASLELPKDYYQLVIMAEVIASHCRSAAHLRQLLATSAEVLRPGGLLLFSGFLTLDGYRPDAVARELGEVFWCPMFTLADFLAAAAGLGLELIENESVMLYEHANLPAGAWPPTGWFEDWVSGGDLFDLPFGRAPIEMRWMTWRRNGDDASNQRDVAKADE